MAKLTAAERRKLPKKVFGLPENAPGSGSYPMEDKKHARSALSRAAANATPAEQKRIRAKAKRLYPGMKVKADPSKMQPLSTMAE